jgi:anti-sigma-K factor RskA
MSADEPIGSGEGGEEDRVLIAEYALGLLDATAHRRLAARIAADPALQAELRLWRGRLSTLDREFAETAPPPRLLERIEARLFPAAQAVHRPGFWESLALWRGLAAAGLAVAVVAVGLAFFRPPQTPEELARQLVAVLSEEGSNVSFVALYDSNAGVVRLVGLSGAPVPEKDYELWAIEGSNPAVSMGVVPVEGRTEVPVAPAIKASFSQGTVLAVTLEQKGGSPTGVAQGPIVAKGAATPI